MNKIYLNRLEALKNEAERLPNTPLMAFAKVSMLVILNMRYEKIMVDRKLKIHPYISVKKFIDEAISFLKNFEEISFIENENKGLLVKKKSGLEDRHRELFQQLWINFNQDEYEQRIQRYIYRLRINKLGNKWLKGKMCIDFGCGHGNFAQALIREGAAYVFGIDFGKDSIKYAIKARDRLGINPKKIEFKVGSVYNIPKENNTFDFAIQNGVFHHLENEELALKEVRRVLKPGGWLWFYTDGSGAITHDLWDASVYILRNLPQVFVLGVLDQLNLKTGKRYHLGDSLSATYKHSTWDGLTKRLKRFGFSNFSRLVGGFDTDFDHDVINKDKYGVEKFGEGDLRLICQLVSK